MENRLVRSYPSARVEKRPAKLHKHTIGTYVTLLGAATDPRSKERRAGISGSEFEITRTLPGEGSGLQYRIKNITSGLEFVVAEDQIAANQ